MLRLASAMRGRTHGLSDPIPRAYYTRFSAIPLQFLLDFVSLQRIQTWVYMHGISLKRELRNYSDMISYPFQYRHLCLQSTNPAFQPTLTASNNWAVMMSWLIRGLTKHKYPSPQTRIFPPYSPEKGSFISAFYTT